MSRILLIVPLVLGMWSLGCATGADSMCSSSLDCTCSGAETASCVRQAPTDNYGVCECTDGGMGGASGGGGSGAAGQSGSGGNGGTQTLAFASCGEASAFPNCQCDPYDTDSCASPAQGCRLRYRFINGTGYRLPDLNGTDGFRATACTSVATQPQQNGNDCVNIPVVDTADAWQDNCAPGLFCYEFPGQPRCVALCTTVTDCGSSEECLQLNDGQPGPALSVCMAP